MIPAVPARTITFDADVLGRRRGGEETMVRGLLEGLGSLDLPFRVLAYVRSADAFAARGAVEPVVLRARSNHLRVAVALPRQIAVDRPALHHGNYILPRVAVPGVVTVHDCSWARLAETMPLADRIAFRRFVPWSVRRARHVVTVSADARRDLLDLLPWLEPEKVTAIPNGVDARYRPDTGVSPFTEAPYVLHVGRLQPRKNVARLLEAFATLRLRRAGPEVLLLAGPDKQEGDAYRALAARLGIADAVRFVGHVADAELPALYAGAEAVVFVSLYEGFGLPVVEAMACGTPVVCSDTTALPETAGGAAMLVDPLSPTAIAAGLERVLDGPGERDRLRHAGLRRAGQLSWTAAAERLVAVYEAVMRSSATRGRVRPPSDPR